MFIISLKYKVPLNEVDDYIPEHIAFLDKHYALGHFLLSGRKEPRTGGLIISNICDRGVLDEILAQDPFFREGLAKYEITQVVPTKASSELAFLLEN